MNTIRSYVPIPDPARRESVDTSATELEPEVEIPGHGRRDDGVLFPRDGPVGSGNGSGLMSPSRLHTCMLTASQAPMFGDYIAAFNSNLTNVVQFTGVAILVLGFSNFIWYGTHRVHHLRIWLIVAGYRSRHVSADDRFSSCRRSSVLAAVFGEQRQTRMGVLWVLACKFGDVFVKPL